MKKKDKENLIKIELCYEGEEPEEDPEYAEHHIYVISGGIVSILKEAARLQREVVGSMIWGWKL